MNEDCLKFADSCPARPIFDQISDKWSMMVLAVLDNGPLRFNEIRRRLEGVTQKSLTHCLRRLERNGLVERRVVPISPVRVEYEITGLGRTLQPALEALYGWIISHMPEVRQAQDMFDRRIAEPVALPAP
ncbi:helix-turn-helix domain-containing protein [Thalassospira sp.]|uniref:winged helix-turn-helix transcriptional regulator n=1 Tax=Thalassospira sp. TaxID=1912094 RepID=UPI0027363D0E|nr:helix-turn-helix domain-containing protein [Thalassospira sp.]MDP2699871.1 helix-turn-helix domain-containing protein [Thalassospira sp.]